MGRGGETFCVLLVLPRRSIFLCLSLVYSFVLGLCFSVFRYCKTIDMIKNNIPSIHPNQNYSREKFGNYLANWKKELTEYYHLIKVFLQVPLYVKYSTSPKLFFKSQKLSTQNLGDNTMKCYTRKTFSKFSWEFLTRDITFHLFIGCTVEVYSDSENNFLGLFFQDNDMKEDFQSYPEIIFIDATYLHII